MGCGDNCKMATGDLCRCECDGTNHGILVDTSQKKMDEFIEIIVEIQCPECPGILKHTTPSLWRCKECNKLFTEDDIRGGSGL